jgi:hypothetical protein
MDVITVRHQGYPRRRRSQSRSRSHDAVARYSDRPDSAILPPLVARQPRAAERVVRWLTRAPCQTGARTSRRVPGVGLSYGSFMARANTTPRLGAVHGTGCCGSCPTGHAKSQAGNRCSRKHNRLRAFGPRMVCSDNGPKARATRQDRILRPHARWRPKGPLQRRWVKQHSVK